MKLTREQFEANLNKLSKERLINMLLEQWDSVQVLVATLREPSE